MNKSEVDSNSNVEGEGGQELKEGQMKSDQQKVTEQGYSGGDESDSEKEDVQEEEFKIDQNVPLQEQFPMRNTFTFGDIVFSSEFDAGNMRKCERKS